MQFRYEKYYSDATFFNFCLLTGRKLNKNSTLFRLARDERMNGKIITLNKILIIYSVLGMKIRLDLKNINFYLDKYTGAH